MLILSCALAAAVAPAQAVPDFRFDKVVASYGPFGPPRRTDDYFGPGDVICYRYSVQGLSAGEHAIDVKCSLRNRAGEVLYTLTTPVKDSAVTDGEQSWGASMIPLTAAYPEGEYDVVVAVHDRLTNRTARFERRVTIKPRELALAAAAFAQDPQGRSFINPATIIAGTGVVVQLGVIGHEDGGPEVSLTAEAELIDSGGQPYGPKRTASLTTPNPVRPPVPFPAMLRFDLGALRRPGKYVLRVNVTDQVAHKSRTFELPFGLIDPLGE
jgi:hypothetical protein